jgi:hypothetical protein
VEYLIQEVYLMETMELLELNYDVLGPHPVYERARFWSDRLCVYTYLGCSLAAVISD